MMDLHLLLLTSSRFSLLKLGVMQYLTPMAAPGRDADRHRIMNSPIKGTMAVT